MTEKNDKIGTEHEEAVPEVTLAEQLIAARERSGYTVDRAAAATRITAEFISSLESGKYQKLPGIVFVRGFIKSLAKLYNTPAEPLIASLERENGEKKPAPAAAVAANRETQKATLVPPLDRGRKAKVEAPKETEASGLGLGKKVAYGIAAAVALILVVVIAQQPKRSDVAQNTATPQETKVVPPVQTAPVVIPETAVPTEQTTAAVTPGATVPTAATATQESTQAVTEPGQNSAATVTAPITGGLQELRVVARNPVRLRYKKDAEQWVTQDLKPDTHTFQFKDSLQVMVYDAAAVDVFFNGKSLGNLGTKGRIRRLNFQTADLSKATAKKP